MLFKLFIPMNPFNNPQLQLAFEFVQFTGKNIFLTGKAGTGKTTFLHNLKKASHKRMIVVAPTGVAAINAGGVTIHSFFQLPFGPMPPGEDLSNRESHTAVKRFSRTKINIIKSLDLLVIDEVSMVRADLLDGIDGVLRRFRDRHKPFGGVQLLMIGDLQQLAPVIKNEDWDILKKYYSSVFFFSSHALMKTNYVSIELRHIFRQSDAGFIELLNRVRENRMDAATLQELNSRCIPGFNPPDSENYITLTTHNSQAQEKNESKLKALPGPEYTFDAVIEGEFPEFSYPTEKVMTLKTGAQVMFVKNDLSAEKLFYNGKIGVIENIEDDVIHVKCPGDYAAIPVTPLTWENVRYTLDEETKEIKEKLDGTFTQYPLKLAWAITIHKSQGLTFEKAIIDAQSSFAHGQVYVALSRCKTLEGMVLSTPIRSNSVKNDTTVLQYTSNIENKTPDAAQLEESKKEYQLMLLLDLFDFTKLQRHLKYLSERCREHAESLIGDPHKAVEDIMEKGSDPLNKFPETFTSQLKQAATENTGSDIIAQFQDRIKKAGMYYSELLDTLICSPLSGLHIETDNKTVRTELTTALKLAQSEAELKRICMDSCREGFILHSYLEVRAKGAIEKQPEKEKKTRPDKDVPEIVQHPALFSLLKDWRNMKAEETGLPHYMILHQKTLLQLCAKLPATMKELKSIKGLGKKKAEQIGADLLEIILDYRRENNIEIPEPEIEIEEPEKKPKIDSKLLSFTMSVAGRSIQEIASERGMAVSTIEGHLAHYVGTGDLELKKFVAPDKATAIIEYFNNNKPASLSNAKQTLGENISYGEIRFVLKHLDRIGKKEEQEEDHSNYFL